MDDAEFKLSDISDVYERIRETRARHQEALAYAFMESTGLKPEEIELVELQTDTGYRWFYKKLERPELRYHVFPTQNPLPQCLVTQDELDAGDRLIEKMFGDESTKNPYTVTTIRHKNEFKIPPGTKLGRRPTKTSEE